MVTVKYLTASAAAMLLLMLTACNASNSSSPEMTRVSFSVTDAPVDFADEVNVTYESFTLTHKNGNQITIPVQDGSGSAAPMKVNLLDYQNGKSKMLIFNAEVEIGEYTELVVNAYQCPQNKTDTDLIDNCNVIINGIGETLKIPGNKLKLGGFEVINADVQSFTIDFQLRQALTDTGGQGYNLKPHGIRIIDNKMVGGITGTIGPELLSACGQSESGYQMSGVYLYQTPVMSGYRLGDEFDPALDRALPAKVISPYASQLVKMSDHDNNYRYQFGFLPPGTYDVAFSCQAADDNPEVWDQLVIPNPSGLIAQFEIQAGKVAIHNFSGSDILR